MRPYKATGVLVSMIFKILMKVVPFMIVLAIVILGFATAFYSILDTDKASSNNASALKYNTVDAALRTSFSYMLGSYELVVLDAGPSDVMLSILWAVFSVIVSILLLNLLIAIISYNFEKLYETSEHSYMMEKTKVVLQCHMNLSSRRRVQLDKLLKDMPYIVIIKPYVYTEETSDKWANRIDTITKSVNEKVNNVQAEITELKQEMSNLKSLMEQTLKAVQAIDSTSTTGSSSVDDNDEHNVAATPPTTSTTAAAAEEAILGRRSVAVEIAAIPAVAQEH
jgi:Ion transport protein